MHEISELGVVKWAVENIALPLLGGLWGALAWWVNVIAAKFSKLEDKHSADNKAIHERITALDRHNADTYARQEYVREGFARIESKLDLLVKHALKDSQG